MSKGKIVVRLGLSGYGAQRAFDMTKLASACQAAYAAIDVRFHDLRHEAGSRMIEDGWPMLT